MTKLAPLTVVQSAEALNVSVHTIRAWIARRRIGHVKLGRAVRVPQAEIDRLLSHGEVPPQRAIA